MCRGLPDHFTVSGVIREQELNKFLKAFNERNMDALYNMLGPVARVKFTREDIEKNFGSLVEYFGSIESGAYAHSELTASHGDTNVYVLHYTVKLSKESKFGSAGELALTIAVQNDDYQIYGIYLNANTDA